MEPLSKVCELGIDITTMRAFLFRIEPGQMLVFNSPMDRDWETKLLDSLLLLNNNILSSYLHNVYYTISP